MISQLEQFPLDSSLIQLFSRIENLAFQKQHAGIRFAHVVRVAADIPSFAQALLGPASSTEKIEEMVRRADAEFGSLASERITTDMALDQPVCAVLRSAVLEAQSFGAARVNIDHLALALLHNDRVCNQFIPLDEREWRKADAGARERLRARRTSVITHTPTLDLHSTDLTKKVQNGDLPWPLCGRQAELLQVQRILLRRTKKNPLLVGPAGSGKTALLTGLAASLLENPVMSHWRVVELDLASFIAGTIYRGEMEARAKRILRELQDNPSVRVAVDEVHGIYSGGSETSSNVAEFFKPALASGELSMIGATCPEQLSQFLRDSAMMRRFEPVFIEPLDAVSVRQVLTCACVSLVQHYESEFGAKVSVPEAVLEEIPVVAAETMHGRVEPDASLTLLQDVIAAALVREDHRLDFTDEEHVEVTLSGLEEVARTFLHTDKKLRHALRNSHDTFTLGNSGHRLVRADATQREPRNN